MGPQFSPAARPLVLTARNLSPQHPRPARRQASPRKAPPGVPVGPDRPGLAVRRTAARLLGAVIETRTSLDGLVDNEHGHPHYLALSALDRSLVRAILGATLRHRNAISATIATRLDRPLPANATALVHILHVAIAQIACLDVPDRAAVDLAVTQAGDDPRTRRFAGLVNAILRGVVRDKESGRPVLPDVGEGPDWLRDRLAANYGYARSTAILSALSHEAPVDFTVRGDAGTWATALGGIVLPTGSVRLRGLDGPVSELPGYGDGQWWVQDAAAALPARLFGDIGGRDVADVCAAPGGKTAQLAAAGARVTAVDLSANRLKRLGVNLQRLNLEARLLEADLLRHDFAGEQFDAVLLDAPCSSTGTIRRHPDVPWTKTPDDIAKLADLQRRMLDRAVDLVKPGGRLVFSNCSLDPMEGEAMLAALLADRADVELDRIDADEIEGISPFVAPQGWLRTLPDGLPHEDPRLSGLDGFFAARLRRLPAV